MLKILKDGFLPTIRRHKGKLVFHCSDDFSQIEVVDYHGDRSLHFGTPEKQSSMNLKNPNLLVLAYTKAMMTGLLFMRTPRTILNLGLGGASLPKFFLNHFPDCKIDIVELRPEVVRVAFDYFALPKDPRLTIYVNDAKDFFRKKDAGYYDLILLDIFNKRGMVNAIGESPFLKDCRDHLTEKGIMISNLWSKPDSVFKDIISAINTVFENQTFHLPVAERTNHIVFAMNHSLTRYPMTMIERNAQQLDFKYKLGLQELYQKLYTHQTRL